MFACKYCIMTKGLKGSEINQLPKTQEELYKHIESEHHIPVRGENETEKECLERFQKENPEASGPNCKCPGCQAKRSALVELLSNFEGDKKNYV